MKFSTNLLGQEVSLEGPDTPEAFDALAPGGPGSCLKLAMRDIMYRPVASKFRPAVVEFLEKNALNADGESVQRLVTKKVPKTKGGFTEIKETDEVYHDRCVELKVTSKEHGDHAATMKAAYAYGIEKVGSLNDLIKSVGTGRSDIGEQWISRAEATLAKWATGESTKEKFVAQMQTVFGDDFELSEEPSVEEVAKAIKGFFAKL